MEIRETGIPCFECGKYSGIDCPGRKPDEATRCAICMYKFSVRAFFDQYGRDELDDATKRELITGSGIP